MKKLTGFLIIALALVSTRAYCTPVATTAGSNLTAYNPGSGAINNNTWNNMMNGRSGGGTGAVADFGNCNSLILRCASPKCANGGCVDVSIARPIVAGCVAANAACKQHGDALIDTLAAQLVANSVAKSNNAANAAAEQAAAAAAQQSAQQIQQMQMQMQQMQSQMAAQNAETVAQLQAALDEQKQMAAQREAEAAAASAKLAQQNASGLTSAQEAAAANGVSADVLVRNQISGEIMTEIENAEKQLKKMQEVMLSAFEYAGCDASGNGCTGPARVKRFKEIASEFFTPYEDTVDAIYDALSLAQMVGVDLSDIYMMLSDSCNLWGQYLCGPGQAVTYTGATCQNGKSVTPPRVDGSAPSAIIAGVDCKVGGIIDMNAGGCQPLRPLTDRDEVKRTWDWSDTEANGNRIEIGCMSAALDGVKMFARRSKKSNVDIEVLQRILQQDALVLSSSSSLRNKDISDVVRYCATGRTGFDELQKAIAVRKLPDIQICIDKSEMKSIYEKQVSEAINNGDTNSSDNRRRQCRNSHPNTSETSVDFRRCMCNSADGASWDSSRGCVCNDSVYSKYNDEDYQCVDPATNRTRQQKPGVTTETDMASFCKSFGGRYNMEEDICDCSTIADSNLKTACETKVSQVRQNRAGASVSRILNGYTGWSEFVGGGG